MGEGRVVHCKYNKYDVYVGRPPKGGDTYHFGNPFAHKAGTRAAYIVKTREQAINCFREWLAGTAYQDFAPKRRQWILDHVKELKGKVLGCWCAPDPCHGDVLLDLANRT